MSGFALRFGEGAPRTCLILPALFEEANRMRRFTVSLMRALADRNITTMLPDLPGQGESTIALDSIGLDDWHSALADIAATLPKPLYSIAIRGGALLDGPADYRWRLAPESGARILRDMVRATALSQGKRMTEIDAAARSGPTHLAGNRLAPRFYAELAAALVPEGKSRTPDLTGARLWRSAEPAEDAELLAAAVTDIVKWLDSCAAS
ncbi:MAG: hypothetical protein ACKVOP_10995 [Sphingomonadaceae bacterium]